LRSKEVPPIRNYIHMNKEFVPARARLEHLAMLKAEGVKSTHQPALPTEHRATRKKQRRRSWACAISISRRLRRSEGQQVAEFLRITDDPDNRPVFYSLRRVDSRRALLANPQGCCVKAGLSKQP